MITLPYVFLPPHPFAKLWLLAPNASLSPLLGGPGAPTAGQHLSLPPNTRSCTLFSGPGTAASVQFAVPVAGQYVMRPDTSLGAGEDS